MRLNLMFVIVATFVALGASSSSDHVTEAPIHFENQLERPDVVHDSKSLEDEDLNNAVDYDYEDQQENQQNQPDWLYSSLDDELDEDLNGGMEFEYEDELGNQPDETEDDLDEDLNGGVEFEYGDQLENLPDQPEDELDENYKGALESEHEDDPLELTESCEPFMCTRLYQPMCVSVDGKAKTVANDCHYRSEVNCAKKKARSLGGILPVFSFLHEGPCRSNEV